MENNTQIKNDSPGQKLLTLCDDIYRSINDNKLPIVDAQDDHNRFALLQDSPLSNMILGGKCNLAKNRGEDIYYTPGGNTMYRIWKWQGSPATFEIRLPYYENNKLIGYQGLEASPNETMLRRYIFLDQYSCEGYDGHRQKKKQMNNKEIEYILKLTRIARPFFIQQNKVGS